MQYRCRRFSVARLCLPVLCALPIGLSLSLPAQTTISTGTIVGTVTDPSDALIAGAQATIRSRTTAQIIHVTTNSAGAYNSGALMPDDYLLQVSSKGFQTASLQVAVLVGNTTSRNVRLRLGTGTEAIEVRSLDLVVNAQQAMVQGVLELATD